MIKVPQEGRNIQINKELAKMYIKQLKELAEEEKILSNIEVMDIAKIPDILTVKADEDDEKINNCYYSRIKIDKKS